ncbi:unnamed protein product [Diamesa serratosioi]
MAVSALSTFPVRASGFTTEISESEIEEPKTLPLTAAQDLKAMKNVNEIWQEDEREVLIRNERGAKDSDTCRYTKGVWTECDVKSNTRSRTLTLKKGEGSCVATRTIQKKCKKACRYDKGAWAECQIGGEMTRTDKLKAASDSAACPATRTINKKCNKSKQEKQNKDRTTKDKKQKDRKNRQ